MHKTIWIIIIIAVITIFTIGASKVWGELPVYEDTVTFTIPENGTVTIRGCYFAEFSEENGIDYRCQWHINVDDVEAFLDEILEEFDERRAELEEPEEEPVDVPTSNFIPEDKPRILTKFEEKLEYYEEHPPETYDQIDEMEKLEALKVCENRQGIENMQGIQDERIIWSSKYFDLNPTPHTNVASPIEIAIQECIAQLQAEALSGRGRATLEGEFLSAQDFFERLQPTHQEMAVIPQDGWLDYANIPTHDNYPQPKQQDFSESQQFMCNSNKVLPEYKEEHNCSPEQVAIHCIAVECNPEIIWNTTGIGEGKKNTKTNDHNTEGGGEIPINGWNMTPESEWTDEQKAKCNYSGNVLLPNAYLRAICGTTE